MNAWAGLVCAPIIHPDFRLVGAVVGALCPHCHHSNIAHDTRRGVCALCDVQQIANQLREIAPHA